MGQLRTLARKVAALILATAILASTAPSVFADFDLEAGGNAVVAYTGGESVKVRAGTGTDFDVITTAPEGAVVTIIAGPFESLDGTFWYGLSYQGTIGYIMADFLALPGNAPAIPVSAMSSPISGGGGYSSIITGTGGDGARIRDGASLASAVVIYAVENAQVDIIGSPLNSDGYAWYPVSYLGYIGWVAGDFLGSGSSTAMAVVAQTATPSFEYGAHVQVSGTGGDDLRIRESVGLDGSIVGHAGPGEVLSVLDGPLWDAAGNGWYAVDYDGLSGYASAGFLNWTSNALTARSVVAASVPAPAAPAAPAPEPVAEQVSAPAPAAPPSNTSRGQALVNVAMRYLGYSYVWGGSSPSGFDCSGFTKYVASSALSIGLSSTVASQIGAGTAVNPKNLEPGDLVFFVNTYEAGLSHVGIYIGGGQMIHAGSERTGVVISNIWDSYWGPKFYAARRL
jgi:cell wall-associated NlpC family hydrolase/uncharacterized protein YraI